MVWKSKTELKYLLVRGLPSMVEHFLAVAFPRRRLLASMVDKKGAVTYLVQPEADRLSGSAAAADASDESRGLERCGAVLSRTPWVDADDVVHDYSEELAADEAFNAASALQVRWIPSGGWERPSVV